MCERHGFVNGEDGIRTHVKVFTLNRFSKPTPSAARPPLPKPGSYGLFAANARPGAKTTARRQTRLKSLSHPCLTHHMGRGICHRHGRGRPSAHRMRNLRSTAYCPPAACPKSRHWHAMLRPSRGLIIMFVLTPSSRSDPHLSGFAACFPTRVHQPSPAGTRFDKASFRGEDWCLFLLLTPHAGQEIWNEKDSSTGSRRRSRSAGNDHGCRRSGPKHRGTDA